MTYQKKYQAEKEEYNIFPSTTSRIKTDTVTM